jgi:hypothetical protein
MTPSCLITIILPFFLHQIDRLITLTSSSFALTPGHDFHLPGTNDHENIMDLTLVGWAWGRASGEGVEKPAGERPFPF